MSNDEILKLHHSTFLFRGINLLHSLFLLNIQNLQQPHLHQLFRYLNCIGSSSFAKVITHDPAI